MAARRGVKVAAAGSGQRPDQLNAGLTDLDQLSALATVQGFLQINSNPSLLTANGFTALTSVTSSLDIEADAKLTSIKISALPATGSVTVSGNPALVALDLSALHSLTGCFTVTNNAHLATCSVKATLGQLSPAPTCVATGGDLADACFP